MGRGSPGLGVEELCLGETLKGMHAPWQDPGGGLGAGYREARDTGSEGSDVCGQSALRDQNTVPPRK